MVSDMGIDGYSFMLHGPVQVKQSLSVDRPVVDAFQTTVERSGKAKGYVIACDPRRWHGPRRRPSSVR
jgi:hypothetical protein